MRSPIRWLGGKGHFVKELLAHIPPHHTYVEVFGGGAALLFAKDPSPVEVYNDLDRGLVDLFRVLRDDELFARLGRLLAMTPYSRAEYNHCRDALVTGDDCDDVVERARRFYVVARQSFGGRFGAGWGFSIATSNRGMSSEASMFEGAKRLLPHIHSRLMRVQIECQDWRAILSTYDTPKTLFYLDPPYVGETRRDGGYAHELSDDDHRDLVCAVQELSGMVVLSGYDHAIYEPLARLREWTRYDFGTVCHVAKVRNNGILGEGAALKKQPRTESVWLNRAAQVARSAARQLSLFDD